MLNYCAEDVKAETQLLRSQLRGGLGLPPADIQHPSLVQLQRQTGPAAPDRCEAVYIMSKNFASIVVCDFEYEATAGELPNVLCMVAYCWTNACATCELFRLWCGDFGPKPPFDIGPDTLFVAYTAWAEMTCFMTLSWQFPAHIFDQHTAYLAASNVLLPYDPDEIAYARTQTVD